jgi:peptidoglycan hydrolase-like protein with peptidoglycan-binding domain
MIRNISGEAIKQTAHLNQTRELQPTQPEVQQSEQLAKENPAIQAASQQSVMEKKNEINIASSYQSRILHSVLDKIQPQTKSEISAPKTLPGGVETEKSTGVTSQQLGPGSKGPDVEKLQKDLQLWRAMNRQDSSVPAITGEYNKETQDAIREFQTATGLNADGLAGESTLARMRLERDSKFIGLSKDVQNEIRATFNESVNNPELRDKQVDLRIKMETDRYFASLEPSVQKELRTTFYDVRKNPAAMENLVNLSSSRDFGLYAERDAQLKAIEAFRRNPGDSKHISNIKDTLGDYYQLNDLPDGTRYAAGKKEFLDVMFSYTENPIGRQGILNLAQNPNFFDLWPHQQRQLLNGLQKNPNDESPELMNGVLISGSYGKMTPELKDFTRKTATELASDPEGLRALNDLMNDPVFANAPKEDQLAQINALRPRNKEIEF